MTSLHWLQVKGTRDLFTLNLPVMSDEVCVMCVVAVVLLLYQDHDFQQYSEMTRHVMNLL